MSGSVGEIKLPIVSTFDPAGTTAAKAALKDLDQAKGGGAGGDGGGGPAAPKADRGIAQLTQGIGSMVGGPGGDLIRLLTGDIGLAAGAVAAVGITQRMAANAQSLRVESTKLGVTTTYYQGLAYSARHAGVEIGSVTAGIEKMQGLASSAVMGNRADQKLFSSLGLSQEDLARGADDSEYLARRLSGQNLTGSQQRQIFGSQANARAIMGAGGGSPTGMSPIERASLEETKHVWADIGDGIQTAFAKSITGWKGIGAWVGGGFQQSPQQIFKEMQVAQGIQDAKERESKMAEARDTKAREMSASLATPKEQALQAFQTINELRKSPDFSAEDANRGRAKAAAAYYGSIAGVSSNAENLANQMTVGGYSWAGTKDPEERQRLARGMGSDITDYAESITRSGGLAGAYDANSVAGYSQQVSAEYAMDQRKDTMRMVELLVKIAENTGRMTKDEGDAVIHNLGFRTQDPIFGGQ